MAVSAKGQPDYHLLRGNAIGGAEMPFWEKPSTALTIQRIVRVNHAGEFGAIRIYGAQMAMAARFYPDILEPLRAMQADEIEHCRLFFAAMPARASRPCRVMQLWSLGGYVLGFATALFGRNMVWICTEAVEATVHRHLDAQLRFLRQRDPELHALIASIRDEELSHLHEAEERQRPPGAARALLLPVIATAVELLIWLSTWGDSSWLGAELDR